MRFRLTKLSMVLAVVALISACSDGKFTGSTPSKSVPSEKKEREVPLPTPQGSDANSVKPITETAAEIVWPKCMTPTIGSSATKVEVKGENWLGNSIDRGGADYDDYFVIITGKFRVDGYQIFSLEDQDITVDYSLGTPGSTTQVVSLQMVDCDHKSSVSEDVSRGSGNKVLKAKRGDRFNLFTTANTSGSIRRFDLIKDNSMAYRVNIQAP